MHERRQVADLDPGDRALINALQGEFPISERPYAEAAAGIGMSEEELLERLGRLRENGVLTRFGPMFQIERMGGAFCLAALAVPEADYERVAERVNALPQVAHNYRREHALNMWFVLATETREGIGDAIAAIEAATGLVVHAFPKEREYFVEMRLKA
ncbi:Lrp/AsnC family transcriptional regulator [Denitratisoma oestradiolicum]|uniref:Siroheme decarboxylase NirG subunit n=1 Tax=Denitratisoma oestradiolicum TaxID=311182 RepID=A0A6S6XYT5_9PROT|nr:AsnC family transcriptional regulator [Denitratisoma oestradiolicum]TWO78808.1 AsnC family protein [Denitratisoma oestradiolicum]CAB1370103.1 Protein NirG [Denitratisoma oestradiolicum]